MDGSQESPAGLTLYPRLSPLLGDPIWIREFREALQAYRDNARAVSENHHLPGFPLFDQFQWLYLSFAVLLALLWRAVGYDQEPAEGQHPISIDLNVLAAFRWACGLVSDSPLNFRIPGPDQPQPTFDAKMVPSAGEIQALQAILNMISPDRAPETRPRWDRTARQLRYGEVLCREYAQEAPNQFTLLDAFEAASWPNAIDSPFPTNESRLRETVGDLNEKLSRDSPIKFRASRRPEWYLISRSDRSD